jgi:hypothetical protein
MKIKIQNQKLFCVNNGYYLSNMQYSPIESQLWLKHGHKMTSPSLFHSSGLWSEKLFENVKLLTTLKNNFYTQEDTENFTANSEFYGQFVVHYTRF